jgi:predicted DnaQ family exonuclease/DinG family helicase
MPESELRSPLPAGLLSALGLSRFVVFDVETTGLDPRFERMIEIGAVRWEEGRETESFSALIRSPSPLPPEIVKLTGITDEMLKSAPPENSVLKEFRRFIGADPLAGHNVSFDLGFLSAAFQRQDPAFDPHQLPILDSALLARVLLPTLPSRSLAALGAYFDLDLSVRHRALADARRTGEVLIRLLAFFPRVDIKTVDILRRLGEGLHHPSSWIFRAWSDFLMQTASIEGSFLPYRLPGLTDNVIGRATTAVAAGDDVTPATDISWERIEEDDIASFFSDAGPLRLHFPQFEFRPEQAEMAIHAARTFNDGGILTVEAGTGVGKSLAYLVPAIAWANANQTTRQRVIVSTNTRNLQDQLFFKDLPQLEQIFAAGDPDDPFLNLRFTAVLLKGRNNYLCRRRWESLISEQPLRLSTQERMALLPLVIWSRQTRTGDVSEVGAFGGEGSNSAWALVASDPGSCRGRRCLERSRCFHARIRSYAARAHIVVVNHALLLSDLAADHAPIGAYSALVVDEAHHLEHAAAEHLGKELNSWMFRSWTGRLYDAEGPPTGLIARMLLGLDAASSDHPNLPGLKTQLEGAAAEVQVLRKTALEFFRGVTAAAREAVPSAENEYTPKLRLRDPPAFLQITDAVQHPLWNALQTMLQDLARIITALEEIPVAALPRGEEWKDDLNGALEELLQYAETFRFFFSPPDENWVYWAELPRKPEYDAQLYAAPLNAGDILRDQLFAPLRSVVLTSATLTVAGRFTYFLRKIGLREAEHTRKLKLGSPFDFPRQMRIGLPAFLPAPRHADFELQVAELMRDLLKRVPRGTLGLFTSHRMLRTVGSSLERDLPPGSLLMQGVAGSRDQLLRRFREEPGSVLLGTDSFWEGIDVVGEALELLVVSKLPFEVPSEPLVEARLEKLKAEGKDPFLYYTVPEAVIRLRQGVGRLIRSRTDRGAALICDVRLLQSRYGKAFLDSLPVPVKIYETAEAMIEDLEHFFSENSTNPP